MHSFNIEDYGKKNEEKKELESTISFLKSLNNKTLLRGKKKWKKRKKKKDRRQNKRHVVSFLFFFPEIHETFSLQLRTKKLGTPESATCCKPSP